LPPDHSFGIDQMNIQTPVNVEKAERLRLAREEAYATP